MGNNRVVEAAWYQSVHDQIISLNVVIIIGDYSVIIVLSTKTKYILYQLRPSFT